MIISDCIQDLSLTDRMKYNEEYIRKFIRYVKKLHNGDRDM